jgi:hypothetical protein
VIAVCEMCKREGREDPFKCPWGDHVGPALMKAHLSREHHIEVIL